MLKIHLLQIKVNSKLFFKDNVSTGPIHPADVFIPHNAGDSSGFYKGF